jgi:hypothetical protein
VLSEPNTNQNPTDDAGNPANHQQTGAAQPNSETADSGSEIHAPKAYDKRHKAEDAKKHWLEYATASFALIAAIGAITAAIFAGYQGWIARDTEIQQLRAYIAISMATRMNIDTEKTQFTLDNFGQTPAKNVRIVGQWEFVPYGEALPADFAFIVKGPHCGPAGPPGGHRVKAGIQTIFPKNPGTVTNFHCPGVLSNLQRADRGELNAFLYGNIDYFDVFNYPRRSNYCLIWLSTLHASLFCDRHNEIDPDE